MISQYIKNGIIILIVGVLLFGVPFAQGAADLAHAAGVGLYTFVVELRDNGSPAGSNAVG